MAEPVSIVENDKIINRAVAQDAANYVDPEGREVVDGQYQIGWVRQADGSFAPPIPPVAERKKKMQTAAEREYNAILKRGVSWNGVRWAATDANRDTLVELHETAQELGQSVTVLDAENSAHTLTAADLSSLRAAGRSYRHAARENRLALHGQIDAATTHGELDTIDVTAGWPT